jgi:hypothetical protein
MALGWHMIMNDKNDVFIAATEALLRRHRRRRQARRGS